MKSKPKPAEAVSGLLRQAKIDLDDIRDRISRLREEEDRVRHRPVDRAEVERRVDSAIARARENDPADVYGLCYPTEPDVIGRFNAHARDDVFAAFASVMPDRLKEALMRNATADGVGISEMDRQAEIAQIAEQRMHAEIAEELACREIEDATNAHQLRRLDAVPAILLAHDEDIR